MFKRTIIVTGFIAFILLTNNAFASITGIEDYGWFTRDTVNHLDFLDVDTFVSQNWDYFESGIDYNGRHWRLASVEEVTGIWHVAQPKVPIGVGRYIDEEFNDPYISELLNLFGLTYPGTISYKYTLGWTSTLSRIDNTIEYYHSAWLYDLVFYGTDGYITDQDVDYRSQSETLGAWLVSPAPVPIPGAALLFVSSLFGLVGIRRKFKK